MAGLFPFMVVLVSVAGFSAAFHTAIIGQVDDTSLHKASKILKILDDLNDNEDDDDDLDEGTLGFSLNRLLAEISTVVETAKRDPIYKKNIISLNVSQIAGQPAEVSYSSDVTK